AKSLLTGGDSRFDFPQLRRATSLIYLEGAVLELARPFVSLDGDARARCLDIRKAERTRHGPVAEQPLARANDDRKDPQAELIDEVVLQQRLDQVGAAGHVNFASGLSFEPRDGPCGVPGQQRGVVPFHPVKRSRGDVLLHAVQLGRHGVVRIRDARPVCSEDFICPAAEQQGVGLQRLLDDERSEEHTSELQSRSELVCRLLLEKKKIVVSYAVLYHPTTSHTT